MSINHDNDIVKSHTRTAQGGMKGFGQRLTDAAVNLFENPWTAALIAGLIYLLVSVKKGTISHPTEVAYYNYLADAFLHGQTWLRIIPPTTYDLSLFQDHYYLYWGPFPAFLLMPFVAIFGVKLNDVLYTLIIAAINIGLFAQLLRAANQTGFLKNTKIQRAILVFFLAFGTVHFPLAPFGKVWMTGQLVSLTCVLLAYLAAFLIDGGLAWLFTGLALACALLTRTQMVFCGIFPFFYLLFKQKPWKSVSVVRYLAAGAGPLVIAIVIMFLYNQTRFGNGFDSGMNYQLIGDVFKDNFYRYGMFNIRYVPTNIYYEYIFYPIPFTSESLMGGSLFLLSPLFFGIFSGIIQAKLKWSVWALLASIFVTNLPIILLNGTGWVFFGPRYTLDFTVPLLILTALGIENWKTITSSILAVVSALQYLYGVSYLQ